MSAYALPGLIFPPLPCYLHSNAGTSRSDGGCGNVDESEDERRSNEEKKTEQDDGTVLNDDNVAQVVVKSAKVDIMQLVSSSTERSSSSSDSKSSVSSSKGPIRTFFANRRERRRRIFQQIRKTLTSSSEADDESSYGNNSLGSGDATDGLSRSCNTSYSSNPQERAIQFELSVSYRDRTYDGVRSLARIRQLYQELVDGESYDPYDEEDEYISNSDPCCETASPEYEPHAHALEGKSSKQNQQSRKSTSKQSIPDLPEMFGGDEYVATTNFRALYGNLHQYYAPAIESWFQSLFAVITPRTSSVLAYFLCEPSMLLKGDSNDPQHQHNAKKCKRSSSRLEMIVEEERVDDDE